MIGLAAERQGNDVKAARAMRGSQNLFRFKKDRKFFAT
jgi:hypothetical protein